VAAEHDPPDLEEVMAVLRLGPADVADERPPDDLWDRIAAQAMADPGAADDPGPLGSGAGASGTAGPGFDDSGAGADGIAGAGFDDSGAGADGIAGAGFDDSGAGPQTPGGGDGVVVPLDQRVPRRRTVAILAAAVAAAVLLAVPLVLIVRQDSELPPADEVADLTRLDGFAGSAHAERRGRELTVEATGLDPADDQFYELWLLDLDDGELIDLRSLGPIDDDGIFTIPSDVDLADYDVVDISVEPDDGDPAHSGVSVLRGELA
jgi:hypothetical protein